MKIHVELMPSVLPKSMHLNASAQLGSNLIQIRISNAPELILVIPILAMPPPFVKTLPEVTFVNVLLERLEILQRLVVDRKVLAHQTQTALLLPSVMEESAEILVKMLVELMHCVPLLVAMQHARASLDSKDLDLEDVFEVLNCVSLKVTVKEARALETTAKSFAGTLTTVLMENGVLQTCACCLVLDILNVLKDKLVLEDFVLLDVALTKVRVYIITLIFYTALGTSPTAE